MNPSDRYFQVRESCMNQGKTVPNRLLRAHLDFMRKMLRFRPGLYPTVITVTQNASAKALDLFPNGLDRSDVIVRAEGQHYGPNAI